MAKWKLYRRHPAEANSPYDETGEVYDDATVHGSDEPPLSIADYLALRRREDGWSYKADPA